MLEEFDQQILLQGQGSQGACLRRADLGHRVQGVFHIRQDLALGFDLDAIAAVGPPSFVSLAWSIARPTHIGGCENQASPALSRRSFNRHCAGLPRSSQCLSMVMLKRMVWKWNSRARGWHWEPCKPCSVIMTRRWKHRLKCGLLKRYALKWLFRNCSTRRCGAMKLLTTC